MPTRPALLLSATVAPGETPYLKLRDPGQREQQYLSALASWCDALPANWVIVVAENSNWPTSAFIEVGRRSGRAIRVLECQDRGSSAGKGVGEAGLIDDFVNSGLARECDWIFKCTGRLFVHNIGKCLPPLDDRGGVCGAIVPSLDHMDSRFFGGSRDVFNEYFTDMGREISEHEGVYMEHVAARRMLSALGAGHAFCPFATLPYLIGRSGSLDSSYSGAGIRLKTFLRQRVRRVAMDREILI
jgi:hypothetical protein